MDAPLLVIETSLLADPTKFTTFLFLMVKEIPEAGTVWPLTEPVPDFMIPKNESLASEVVNIQLRLIWEPKGLGMDWAWFGAKSKLRKAEKEQENNKQKQRGKTNDFIYGLDFGLI